MTRTPTNARAMALLAAGTPLQAVDWRMPTPAANEVLLTVEACGVCRTDLHLLDGELPDIAYPIIPGHEIVGRVASMGPGVTDLRVGQRVGVPWLGHTCGHCEYCRTARENLCDAARFTGYQIQGGYASHCVAEARFCFPLPDDADAAALAPLLCAGLIGHRALTLAGDAQTIGIYGFGAAAHIICQVARHQGRRVFAFTRPDDRASQAFALRLGAVWAGGSLQAPPQALDAALIFAAVGDLVPAALRAVRKGGTVVCAGIHMSDIPSFPYAILWGERTLRSVANLTRRDGEEFFSLVPGTIPVRTEITRFPLAQANEALARLRAGALQGAAVLIP